MPEWGSPGSVRGAGGDSCPYRDCKECLRGVGASGHLIRAWLAGISVHSWPRPNGRHPSPRPPALPTGPARVHGYTMSNIDRHITPDGPNRQRTASKEHTRNFTDLAQNKSTSGSASPASRACSSLSATQILFGRAHRPRRPVITATWIPPRRCSLQQVIGRSCLSLDVVPCYLQSNTYRACARESLIANEDRR